jgi:flagellar protein FliO/FliZ
VTSVGRKLAALAATVHGTVAWAGTPATASPNAASGFGQVALSLLLIIFVIFGLAWVATRLRLTPRAASAGLRILADVPVGPKERVVLLKVGDGQALVGVSADGVRSLTLLEKTVELPVDTTGSGAFANRLKALMDGGRSP